MSKEISKKPPADIPVVEAFEDLVSMVVEDIVDSIESGIKDRNSTSATIKEKPHSPVPPPTNEGQES